MNASPATITQVLSAARGRVCYNVESHVNFGSVAMHQRRLGLPDLLSDWLPQIGLGIKGFLFWQFRPEVLGAEAPAWGVVKLDGDERPVTRAVRGFWQALAPHAGQLLQAMPAAPEVGIWKSRKNEIFHFAAHNSLQPLVESVEGYQNALYWNSYRYRVISDDMLAASELEELRVLIMPSPYYLTRPEADALDAWVRRGGLLLCEAHLGGYNGTTGRHSRRLPGCGLCERWSLHQTDSTSSYHLRLAERQEFTGTVPEDVQKALRDAELHGGRFYPIRLRDGGYVWGANRYASLEAEDATVEGSFDGHEACILSKSVGEGRVIYCGTNLGEGATRDSTYLEAFLRRVLTEAGVRPTLDAAPEHLGTVHVDALLGGEEPAFLVVIGRAAEPQQVTLTAEGVWRGLYTGTEWRAAEGPVTVPASFADLMVRGQS